MVEPGEIFELDNNMAENLFAKKLTWTVLFCRYFGVGFFSCGEEFAEDNRVSIFGGKNACGENYVSV
jgi:hypothetical protein